MNNRGGRPRFGPGPNFRHQGPQTQRFGGPPQQRFQGAMMQPWPEMGSWPGARMNQPRMDGPPRPPQFGPHGPSNMGQGWTGPNCARPPPNYNGPFRQPGPPNNDPGVFFRHNQSQRGPRPPHNMNNQKQFNRPPGNHPNQKQGNKQKKQKVDKRDLPENNRYFCEVCDRGYKDLDKYEIHIQSHEKCPEEGCSYVAVSKLVQLHIRLQHNSGLAKKIWSLESKEDIEKWRLERKKNFPTAENIAKKKADLAERIARGEVIEEKYFGKMRGGRNQRGGRGRGRERGQRGRGGREQHSDLKRKLDSHGTNGAVQDCSGAKKPHTDVAAVGSTSTVKEQMESLGFFDTAGTDSSESSSDDDDDDARGNPAVTTGNSGSVGVTPLSTPSEPVAAGALGSLIAMYSDSGSDNDEPVEMSNTGNKNKKPSPAKPSQNPKKPGQATDTSKPNRQRGRSRNKKTYRMPPPAFDKSLLEKLLAKEIRQERNKILQCVYHIVKKNFFDKPVTSNSTANNAPVLLVNTEGDRKRENEEEAITANATASSFDVIIPMADGPQLPCSDGSRVTDDGATLNTNEVKLNMNDAQLTPSHDVHMQHDSMSMVTKETPLTDC